ncbi:MAG: hypothetical protein ACKOC8_09290 [Pirellulales bacterium]
MATHSEGISVTWNGTPFAEVTDLSWEYGGGLPKGRSTPWTDDIGTVSVQCLASTNVSTASYGTRATLAIAGGGAALTVTAVYERVAVSPELNGITRYTVTFRILDG